MATRMFCDHCGNTIHTANVYSYGPLRKIQTDEMAYQQAVTAKIQAMRAAGGGLINSGNVQIPAASTPPTTQMINVDLCNNCVPIWMERVKKLTSQSDV